MPQEELDLLGSGNAGVRRNWFFWEGSGTACVRRNWTFSEGQELQVLGGTGPWNSVGGYGAVLEGVELWGRVCNCIGGSETVGEGMELLWRVLLWCSVWNRYGGCGLWNSVGEGMELAELHTYMICLWEVKLLGRVLIVELL